MKASITLFALLATVVAASRNLDNYTFEQFLQDYNLKYETKEYATRKQLFEKELQRVRVHNSKNSSWKEGINKFSAMTSEEKKVSFGRLKVNKKKYLSNLKSQQDLPESFVVRPVSELPASVDWRDKGKLLFYGEEIFFLTRCNRCYLSCEGSGSLWFLLGLCFHCRNGVSHRFTDGTIV